MLSQRKRRPSAVSALKVVMSPDTGFLFAVTAPLPLPTARAKTAAVSALMMVPHTAGEW